MPVGLGYNICTLFQLCANGPGRIPNILLIFQLVIQTRPEIHGNGAYLHLLPPLTITREELDRGLAIMEKVMK